MVFVNLSQQPEFAGVLAEYAYGSNEIKKGRLLFDSAQMAYDDKLLKSGKESKAYQEFTLLRVSIAQCYSRFRKKAKVVFRKDKLMLDKLAVSGKMPTSYVSWFEVVQKFVDVALSNEDVGRQLARLLIGVGDLRQCNDDLVKLNDLRAIYLKEKGESQNATQIKDMCLAALDDWMREFYAVANIAMEDKPQISKYLSKEYK